MTTALGLARVAKFAGRMATYNATVNIFSEYARMAADYESSLYHYSELLKHVYHIQWDEIEHLFDISKDLAKWNGCSTEQTIDCLVTGLVRQTYLPLDNIGLSCQHIRDYYQVYRQPHLIFDDIAWYHAVYSALALAISRTQPYTIKTQVTDLGNGYGRVDRIITGNDFVIPQSYIQTAMKTALSQMVVPALVDTGTLRSSVHTVPNVKPIAKTEILRARVSANAHYIKDFEIKLATKIH